MGHRKCVVFANVSPYPIRFRRLKIRVQSQATRLCNQAVCAFTTILRGDATYNLTSGIRKLLRHGEGICEVRSAIPHAIVGGIEEGKGEGVGVKGHSHDRLIGSVGGPDEATIRVTEDKVTILLEGEGSKLRDRMLKVEGKEGDERIVTSKERKSEGRRGGVEEGK